MAFSWVLLCVNIIMYEDGTEPALREKGDCWLLLLDFILISWRVSV